MIIYIEFDFCDITTNISWGLLYNGRDTILIEYDFLFCRLQNIPCIKISNDIYVFWGY